MSESEKTEFRRKSIAEYANNNIFVSQLQYFGYLNVVYFFNWCL